MDAKSRPKNSSETLSTPLVPNRDSNETPMGQIDTNQTLSYSSLDSSPVPLILEAGPAELVPVQVPNLSELRVLLVDDHDDMLNMMHLLLSRRNYAIATANSGHKALQLMESFAPQIIVSDISMPDMDGYELMATLRAGSHGASFKSIALSGYGMEDDRQRANAAGYDEHLTKPIDFDVLFDLLDRLAPALLKLPSEQNSSQLRPTD